jgi:hypothetical protein
MKPVFLTFVYGDDLYYELGSKLLKKFSENGYDIFVCSDNEEFYPDVRIPYNETRFSYHHKILAIEHLYKLGYKEVLYFDSDLIIFDDKIFEELSNINFNKGITYTRHGKPTNLEDFIIDYKANIYAEKISNYELGDHKLVSSIWEDMLFFNFNDINADSFFEYYRELMDVKHQSDIEDKSWPRYGDQEGYALSIASILSKFPCEINEEFRDVAKNLRAANYSYDGDLLLPILSEIDFIFPFRQDSDKRKENLIRVLEYYKTYFWHVNNLIVSEQGTEQKVGIDGFDYVFTRKELPHNQSKCINDGVRLSKKKYVCVVDSDIILLHYHNIHLALREMICDEIDYALPYTDCFDLPKFKIRRPWGGMCVGGIFIVNREKFIEAGMNNEDFVGWGREDDERHHRLISKGLRFKRYGGVIMHLDHPDQEQLVDTSKNNLDLLKQITNDNDSFNEV